MPRNTNPDATTPATTGPEPSIDTTKRQAPTLTRNDRCRPGSLRSKKNPNCPMSVTSRWT